MRLMVRVLSWNPFVSLNLPDPILLCYFLLVFLSVIFRELPVGFTSTNVWWLLVTSLVSVVCATGVHYIIKSVKRRPAPEFLKLSDEMVHSIHTLVNGSDMRLNKRQCLDLSSKLSQTMQNIQKLVFQCGSSNSVFRPSLAHLYQVLVKAQLLVNDCNNENWIRTSVFQIQNESAFQVILMDVSFCYHAIYEQAKLSMSGKWKNVELEDLRDSSTFEPASMKDVDEDREELRKKLENLVDARNYGSGWLFQVYYFLLVRLSKKLRLAEYLLVKLHCIAQQPFSDGLQLSKRLLWAEESYSSMTWGREVPLGVGSGASGVCKTKWLNIPCAKKCNIHKPYFLKEAGILSHVNYPNIIKFICCGGEWNLGENFIAMELMEMSLSDLIKEKGKKGIPFSYDVAVDILAQIARGMCYLHGLRVAHRDLKPANVVLNVLTSPHLEGFHHVKLVDFGTSKTQVDPFKTTSTEHGFGTLTHKAPEVRHLAPAKSEDDRKWRAVWFKADVWSFAIICLEVLSLKLRKSLDKEDQDLKSMFPTDCPQELVTLLEDCLQPANPRARPDFLEVCSRLEVLRHSLLRRLSNSDQDSLSEMSLDCSNYQFIEMRLKEHFQRQNGGVVVDDDEVEVLIPQASHVEELAFQENFWMDQAPYSTSMEDRELEIWTKQPGNEVFRKAVDEWREECKLIAERIRMTKDQCVALNNERNSKMTSHLRFSLSMILALYEVRHPIMHFWWGALCSLMLLEALFIVSYWVYYEYRCRWRLWKAVRSDLNKLVVYINRYDMLKQKRECFSFEDDAKEYDPSSNSPPKLTRLLLFCVHSVDEGSSERVYGQDSHRHLRHDCGVALLPFGIAVVHGFHKSDDLGLTLNVDGLWKSMRVARLC